MTSTVPTLRRALSRTGFSHLRAVLHDHLGRSAQGGDFLDCLADARGDQRFERVASIIAEDGHDGLPGRGKSMRRSIVDLLQVR